MAADGNPLCARSTFWNDPYGLETETQQADETLWETRQGKEVLNMDWSGVILAARPFIPHEVGNPFDFWGPRKRVRWA